MKQILFVLAILISGIASAQSTWETSVCNGEIIHNENNYMVIDNILTEGLQGRIPGGANFSGFFCLSDDITNNTQFEGRDAYNRYFRWYCYSDTRTRNGNSFTRSYINSNLGNPHLLNNYLFTNHPIERYRSISIRIYPDTYSDGERYNNGRLEVQGISNVIERAKQSKFEVRVGADGRSRLSDPDRLKDSAQEAWDYAITH